MNGTHYLQISGGRVTRMLNNVRLSISQWLPCPLAIWAFALDGILLICAKHTVKQYQPTHENTSITFTYDT